MAAAAPALAARQGASAKPFLDVRDAREPRVIARRAGTLTGPRRGDGREIADRWVRGHLPALGLDREDLGSLRLEQRTVGAGGVQTLRWRQYAGGIPGFDEGLRVTLTGDGRVAAVLDTAQPDLEAPAGTPALDAVAAMRRLMDDAGVRRPIEVTSGPTGAERATEFAGGDIATLVLFDERLAWNVTFRAGSTAWYDAVIDAATGAVLRRTNLVKEAVTANVWEQYPGAPRGGQAVPVDIQPWLDPAAVGSRLFGPNAHVWSDVDDDPDNAPSQFAAGAGEDVNPTGPGAPYAFTPFTQPEGACDPSHPCSWNDGTALSWQANREQNAVQAFYLSNRFHDHLEAAPIGFTEADGNMEGTDRVLVHTDDGANTAAGLPDNGHIDNANMATPRDGQPSIMQMYLWFHDPVDSPFRDANSGDDAAILYHEYAHGLSSRLVTTSPGGPQALNNGQSAAMGEGWSDWYAKDFLVGQFPADDSAAPGDVTLGAYLDSQPRSLRSQGIDCPIGAPFASCPGSGTAGSGGYTYGDYGKVGPVARDHTLEVHENGEIWSETLWDLRSLLGSQVARAIVTEGMRQSPAEPSFLQARDAIILADRAIFGAGHHYEELWRVFAARGMGFDASTGDADGTPSPSDDSTPTQGFALPPNITPAGSLSASPAAVTPGQAVQFTAAMSDSDGRIVDYEWDFDGNGTVDRTTAEPTTSFAYAGTGTFAAGVAARDTRNGRGAATAGVTVATPPPPSVAPVLTLPTTGRRFRASFTVTCDSACSGPAKLTVTRRLARRLKLGRLRTVGTATFRMTAAGSRTFRITLSFKTRRAMRRAKVRRLATSLAVVATDAEAQRTSRRRTARIRSS